MLSVITVLVIVIVARTVTQMTMQSRVLLPSFSTSTGSSYVNRGRQLVPQRPRLPLAAALRRRLLMRPEDLPGSDTSLSHVRSMNVNHRRPLHRAY
uniref:Putative secreted protein n=1 Tax=Anopheles marajoara TaxID=58244 RepID=A0A2M4C9A5_9DIPT